MGNYILVYGINQQWPECNCLVGMITKPWNFYLYMNVLCFLANYFSPFVLLIGV
jgi:hypothetical protein